MTVYGLRWRLARRVAPAPIIAAAALPQQQGAYVFIRGEGGLVLWLKAERLRLRLYTPLPPIEELGAQQYRPYRSQTRGRFVGTVLG